MIKIQTKINVADNSGAKKVQCIKTYNGTSASIGDIILVSIKKIKKKIKKGSMVKALVVRTRYNFKNLSKGFVRFSDNSVILLDSKNQPIGTRIFGPISLNLRRNKKLKILSLSSYIL